MLSVFKLIHVLHDLLHLEMMVWTDWGSWSFSLLKMRDACLALVLPSPTQSMTCISMMCKSLSGTETSPAPIQDNVSHVIANLLMGSERFAECSLTFDAHGT